MRGLAWIAIAVIILQASAVYAVEESWDTVTRSGELVTEVELTSSIEIKKDGNDPSIERLNLNLSLIPRNDGLQSVRSTDTNPTASVQEGLVLFQWDDPGFGIKTYSVESEVVTRNDFVPVTGKVAFPVTGIGEELKPFILNSSTIDSNEPEIIALANSLAEGEDDLFVVVYKLAEWNNRNIEYNLSTLTSEVTKPASWVLQNRIGVCDELTNLFIALNRALGIPARYVYGISYTTSELFTESWGFHGWAEVYFPGHGWIPFDPTYGQYGAVDAGHIKLRSSVDASEYGIRYYWRGRDVMVEADSLDVEVTLTEASGEVSPTIELSSQVLKNPVTFGSYNVEEVVITNLKDHYVVAELRHWTTTGLEFLGERKRAVLLEPGEVKREYFIFRVSEDLNQGYIWTFPLTVKSLYAAAETEFKVRSGGGNLSLEEVNSLIAGKQEEQKENREEEIIQHGNLTLDCVADRNEIYVYEDANVTCTANNTGNAALENLSFCHRECRNFSLQINGSREFTFLTDFSAPGNNTAEAAVEGNASGSAAVEIKVLDEPAIAISRVSHPRKVTPDELYEISFTAEKSSTSVPLNVTFSIETAELTFSYDRLENEEEITAGMNASELSEGKNTLTIVAEFKDKNGKSYVERESRDIEVGAEDRRETRRDTRPATKTSGRRTINSNPEEVTGPAAEEEIADSRNLTLDCVADRNEIYVYEDANVTCTANNTGNVTLENLSFCHGQCETFSLGTAGSREFAFLTDFNASGTKAVEARVEGDAFSSSAVEIKVLDEPAINITEISHPEKVASDEFYEISFMAKRTSDSIPLDVNVTIQPTDVVFIYKNLKNDAKMIAEMTSAELQDGKNTLTIVAKFKDKNEKEYVQKKDIVIEKEVPGLWEKIRGFFAGIFG